MKSFISLLFSPYPLPGGQSISRSIRISILTGIFIFLFLFFLSPIDMGIRDTSKKIIVTGSYGVITAIVQMFFLAFIPYYLSSFFNESKWNFLKAISYILLMVLVIAFCNFLFTVWYFDEVQFNLQSFASTIFGTLIVAIFPVTFFVAIDLVKHEHQYKKDSEEIVLHPSPIEIKELLTFPSDYDEESLIVPVDSFLYAEAEGNYVSFYYRKNREVERTMVRTTLKKVQQILVTHSHIVKTHRSYIINLKSINRFEGNAQGYDVYFEGTDSIAKVSRSFTNMVKDLLKN